MQQCIIGNTDGGKSFYDTVFTLGTVLQTSLRNCDIPFMGMCLDHCITKRGSLKNGIKQDSVNRWLGRKTVAN